MIGENVMIISKTKSQKGITLIALAVTIIVLLILAGVSLNSVFSDSGIIKKSQIVKNELEISQIKEALQIYYLNNWIGEKQTNPVKENVFDSSKITDENTKNKIVEYQIDAENQEQIHYERLYELDMQKLGLGETENTYIMDIETRIIFINNGLKVNKGIMYVIEEKEILPATIETEQGTKGFILKANADENAENIYGYEFYINNELYKTVTTSKKTAQIEVTDKKFGEYECYAKINISTGEIYRSTTITAENYYIKNKEDIETFRKTVNEGTTYLGKTVKVVNNINIEGSTTNRNWEPIGTAESAFQGTFDGNNYEIQNLYNKETTADYQGLFGSIVNATIKNVKVTSGQIQGNMHCGAISGYGNESNIQNCNNAINVSAIKGNAGGIIGKLETNSTITGCNNTGNIASQKYIQDNALETFVGGIVGYSVTKIENCTNTGSISAKYGAVGGIAGATWEDLSNCENSGTIIVTGGNINGDSVTGGITGAIHDHTLKECINNGKIQAEGKLIAGIVGIVVNSEIYNCSNKANIVTNKGRVGGIVGGTVISETVLIQNCVNTGEIEANGTVDTYGSSLAGGIAGFIANVYNTGTVEIKNCNNEAKVNAVGKKVGGIVGTCESSNILNSYNSGYICSEKGFVGGIAGASYFNSESEICSEIRECNNTGKVEGKGTIDEYENTLIGGISGANLGYIIKCWNSGDVVSAYSAVGGIVGDNYKEITQCYNIGTIESINVNKDGFNISGGIAGASQQNAIVSMCYNKGEIKADYGYIGSIVGLDFIGTTIKNCYNTFDIPNDSTKLKHQISGNYEANSANVTNCYYLGTTTSGIQRTQADMKTTEFINLIGGTTYWKLDSENKNGGYVIFNWQK